MSAFPASSSLSGADGSGGGVIFDVEPGLRVRARGLRGVDPRVVGVREVVEHQPQRLRGAAGHGAGAGLLLLAARGQRAREQREDEDRQASGHGPPGSVRGVQSTTRRSSSAQAP